MKIKSIRIPADLLKAVHHVEKEEKLEETTAIRKLMRIGYETYLANLYKWGNVTLSEMSRRLGLTPIETLDLLLDRGIKGNIDSADVLRSYHSLRGGTPG